MTLDLPRVGRYRLFDPAVPDGKRHLWKCRLCGRVVSYARTWRHYEVEHLRSCPESEWDTQKCYDEVRLKERLRAVLTRRRKDSHLRRSRWEFRQGRGRDEP